MTERRKQNDSKIGENADVWQKLT